MPRKKRSRNYTAGEPGDVDRLSTKKWGSKKVAPLQEELILKEAIKLNYKIVSKFSKRELDEVKHLYKKEFERLHIFGTRPYINDDNMDMKVNIRYLHRVPPGQVVYRLEDPN